MAAGVFTVLRSLEDYTGRNSEASTLISTVAALVYIIQTLDGYCEFDRIYNRLGEKSSGTFVRGYLDQVRIFPSL